MYNKTLCIDKPGGMGALLRLQIPLVKPASFSFTSSIDDGGGEGVSVACICSAPHGHPVAWLLYHQQRRQILFIIIFKHKASLPLVNVNGLVRAATRLESVTSFRSLGGARIMKRGDEDGVVVVVSP